METKQNSGPKTNKGEKTGLAGILGALGWNTAEGEAASGGLGGLIDAATSGGILATKAGVVALALAGTTIAGGVGWLGYKVLGPGPGDKAHAHFQVFQPRPAQSASGNAQGGNKNSQNSGQSSLGDLSSANQGAMGEAAAPSAAQGPLVAATVGPKSPNLGKAFGGKGPKVMPKLAGAGKIGQLSNLNASGSAAPAKSAAPVHAIAANGLAGGVGSGAPHGAVAGRGFGSSGGGGPGFRAMNGAGTNYGGGLGPNNVPGTGLFDGSHASGLGLPSGSGAGGLGSGASTQFPNASTYGGQFSPQGGNQMGNTGNGNNVTPWQGAINMATMLSLLAAGLMVAAYRVSQSTTLAVGTRNIILAVLGSVIAAVGGFIAYLGSQIAGGQFGQSFQGGAFTLAGTFIALSGAAVAAGGFMGGFSSDGSATDGMSGAMTGIFMGCGAVGLLSAMAGYLMPGQQYPATMFYGNPPDWTNPNAQVNPNPYGYFPSYGGMGGGAGYGGGMSGGIP